MTTQHSPLPWKLSHDKETNRFLLSSPGFTFGHFEGGSDVETFYAEDEANAQFIVTACNSHAALVWALEGLLEFADNGTPIHPGSDVIADARAALNLAKGGK